MGQRKIPPRQPIGDPFDGVVLSVGTKSLLALEAPEGAEVLHRGSIIVRYAVRYLGKPHLSVVPGLLALDYGDMLTGEAAWEFLLKKSNLYPRGEVFGYRNDGRDEMIVVKLLDLAQPIEVLVYADTDATTPTARPTALIAPADAVLPPRLLEYLPRFETLEVWKQTSPVSP